MFTVYKRDVADVEPTVYLPGAADLALGSAAVLTAGSLAKAGTAVKPDYIILGGQRADGTYPAARVQPTTVYAAPCSAAEAAAAGTKVTMDADALGVTATSGGAFAVEGVLDAVQPDGKPIVAGRFA